jgi:FkbM family methyltransferase
MSAYKHLINAYDYDFANLNVLECGSHSCGTETALFRNNNNCYYIEANPDDYKIMVNQPNTNVNNVFNVALYNHIGKIKFTVTNLCGNSSICHSEAHMEELQRHQANCIDIQVDCITYPHFIRNVIKTSIDLLVLDIEGVECEILKTMKELNASELPKFLVIEAGYDWHDRKSLLTELGYAIDFYQFNNVYLTHSSFNVNKNLSLINKINSENRQFVWENKVIFVNNLV